MLENVPIRLPITVLSGFLGAGKTTLVEMTNGCICCTLRDDRLAEVRRLAASSRFDRLVAEDTGIAEPLPIAATFAFRDEYGGLLSDVARLDTVVTVVHAVTPLKGYGSRDVPRDRGETAGESDARTLVDLLVDQIEFADVIVFHKVSDVSLAAHDNARAVIKALNPDARLIETYFGRVPVADLLDTGLFDVGEAHEHPLWFRELNGFRDPVPETEEYGIGRFVYRARRPFDPARFDSFLKRTWPGLIRAKGLFYLATRPAWVGDMSLAGAICRTEAMGTWWAAVPKARRPEAVDWQRRLRDHWAVGRGDRRQELVFIGKDRDRGAIRAALDACLIDGSDAMAFDPARYRSLPDPFPVWSHGHAA